MSASGRREHTSPRAGRDKRSLLYRQRVGRSASQPSGTARARKGRSNNDETLLIARGHCPPAPPPIPGKRTVTAMLPGARRARGRPLIGHRNALSPRHPKDGHKAATALTTSRDPSNNRPFVPRHLCHWAVERVPSMSGGPLLRNVKTPHMCQRNPLPSESIFFA